MLMRYWVYDCHTRDSLNAGADAATFDEALRAEPDQMERICANTSSRHTASEEAPGAERNAADADIHT